MSWLYDSFVCSDENIWSFKLFYWWWFWLCLWENLKKLFKFSFQLFPFYKGFNLSFHFKLMSLNLALYDNFKTSQRRANCKRDFIKWNVFLRQRNILWKLFWGNWTSECRALISCQLPAELQSNRLFLWSSVLIRSSICSKQRFFNNDASLLINQTEIAKFITKNRQLNFESSLPHDIICDRP